MNCRYALLLLWMYAPTAHGVTIEWTGPVGAKQNTHANSVAVDGSGGIYLAGDTLDGLYEQNAGFADAYLTKFDPSGSIQWTRQLGTSKDDSSAAVATDASGNVFITGFARGSLAGVHAGESDVFVAKYNGVGDVQWTRQFGTTNYDHGTAIAADAIGSVYIAGDTRGAITGNNLGGSDGFLRKYDAAGDLQWTRQFGSARDDQPTGMAIDHLGNLYICGYTEGTLPGAAGGQGAADIFVSKYNSNGILQWNRQLGTSEWDSASSIAADELGNVFISGGTNGSLAASNEGYYDAVVALFSDSGVHQWTRQFGTPHEDVLLGISISESRHVYVAGYVDGPYETPHRDLNDPLLAKFDVAGEMYWLDQVRTDAYDAYFDVAAFDSHLYVAGLSTNSTIYGTDAFIRSYSDPIPEPGAGALALIAVAVLTVASREVLTGH